MREGTLPLQQQRCSVCTEAMKWICVVPHRCEQGLTKRESCAKESGHYNNSDHDVCEEATLQRRCPVIGFVWCYHGSACQCAVRGATNRAFRNCCISAVLPRGRLPFCSSLCRQLQPFPSVTTNMNQHDRRFVARTLVSVCIRDLLK